MKSNKDKDIELRNRWLRGIIICMFLILLMQLTACGGSGSSSSGSGGSSAQVQSIDIIGSDEFIAQVNAALAQYTPSCLIRIQSGPSKGYGSLYLGSGVIELNPAHTGKVADVIGVLAHENDHCIKPPQTSNCDARVELERHANLAAARVLDDLGYHSEAKWWRNQWGRHQGCVVGKLSPVKIADIQYLPETYKTISAFA